MGIVLLGTVIAFGISGKGHARASAAGPSLPLTLQSSPSPAGQDAPLPFDATSSADSGSATSQIDLGRSADAAAGAASGNAPGRDASPSPSAADAKKATPSAARASSTHAKKSSAASKPAPSAPAAAANTQPASVNADLSAAIPLSADAPLKTAALAAPAKPADSKPELNDVYIDVASFKDASRADQVVEQLTKQGFHAVSIHKGKLWMRSYHVQVGPYTNQADLDAAHRTLSTQDFKSNAGK